MTDRASAEGLRPRDIVINALTMWKLQDQPDKPRAVVERWAAWYYDTEVCAARSDGGLRALVIQYLSALEAAVDDGNVEPVASAIRALRAALSDTGPRPDSGIDVDTLARAMTVVYEQDLFPIKSESWDYDARLIAREYARLSTPRTETSEP